MKVPQIAKETGVSGDYWNEFTSKDTAAHHNFGIPYLVDIIKRYPLRKYEERFSPKEYEDVITTQNSERIRRLNEIAEIINTSFSDISNFNETDFKNLIQEARILVYGKRRNLEGSL